MQTKKRTKAWCLLWQQNVINSRQINQANKYIFGASGLRHVKVNYCHNIAKVIHPARVRTTRSVPTYLDGRLVNIRPPLSPTPSPSPQPPAFCHVALRVYQYIYSYTPG